MHLLGSVIKELRKLQSEVMRKVTFWDVAFAFAVVVILLCLIFKSYLELTSLVAGTSS